MSKTSITVSFACSNSAMAAKMIEYFDKLQAESWEQFAEDVKNGYASWTEFRPDGSSGPATEPINAVPPHAANPNSSAVPPNAPSAAPVPYQQTPPPTPPVPPVPQQSNYQQPVPPAPPSPPVHPIPQQSAPPAPPAPPVQPTHQQPNYHQAPPAPSVMPSAPPAQQPPNYQQTSMTFTPAPNGIPAASAPVIQRDQLSKALQMFASSAQAHAIQIRELLARFNVDSLNDLPEASLPEFVNSLRGMGCFV